MKRSFAPSMLALLGVLAMAQPVFAQPQWNRDWDHRDERPQRRRDERAPEVSDVAPGNGQVLPEGRVEIVARLDDRGSGVDAGSVRLRLNGRDVTDDARVNAGEVRYRADLRPGRYTAEVFARDNAGNPVRRSWTFDVAARAVAVPAPMPPVARPPVAMPAPVPPVARPPVAVVPPAYAAPLRLAVTSHANGATISRFENVQLQGQTTPGAQVHVEVENQYAGGTVEKIVDETVGADSSGTFRVNFAPTGYVLPGVRYDIRLTARSGDKAVEQHLVLLRRQG